jgi:hypothetical protein
MAADEALTVEIRGARSLKWIKGRIEAYLHTDRPVTAVLQVTVVVDKPATATVNERNAKHNAIRAYIAEHLKAPTEVAVGVTIEIPFEQDEVGLVHYVTRSGYVDILKSTYMKRRLGRIQAELRRRYPEWNVRLNFLLTKPLEYISMSMTQSAVAEEKRMTQPQARDELLEVDMDLGPIDVPTEFQNAEQVDTPMIVNKQE